MTYLGYTAVVEYDDDDKIFVGRVVELRDVIHFEATSVAELETVFHESVDDYLAFCAEQGEEPDRPYSGKARA